MKKHSQYFGLQKKECIIVCEPLNSSGDVYHILAYLILADSLRKERMRVYLTFDTDNVETHVWRSINFARTLGFKYMDRSKQEKCFNAVELHPVIFALSKFTDAEFDSLIKVIINKKSKQNNSQDQLFKKLRNIELKEKDWKEEEFTVNEVGELSEFLEKKNKIALKEKLKVKPSFRENSRTKRLKNYLLENHPDKLYLHQMGTTTIIADYFNECGFTETTKVLRKGFKKRDDAYFPKKAQNKVDKIVKNEIKIIKKGIKKEKVNDEDIQKRPIIILHIRSQSRQTKSHTNEHLNLPPNVIKALCKFLHDKGFYVWGMLANDQKEQTTSFEMNHITFPFSNQYVYDDQDYAKQVHLNLLLRARKLLNLRGVIGNTSGTLDLAAFIGYRVYCIHQFQERLSYQDFRLCMQLTFLSSEFIGHVPKDGKEKYLEVYFKQKFLNINAWLNNKKSHVFALTNSKRKHMLEKNKFDDSNFKKMLFFNEIKKDKNLRLPNSNAKKFQKGIKIICSPKYHKQYLQLTDEYSEINRFRNQVKLAKRKNAIQSFLNKHKKQLYAITKLINDGEVDVKNLSSAFDSLYDLCLTKRKDCAKIIKLILMEYGTKISRENHKKNQSLINRIIKCSDRLGNFTDSFEDAMDILCALIDRDEDEDYREPTGIQYVINRHFYLYKTNIELEKRLEYLRTGIFQYDKEKTILGIIYQILLYYSPEKHNLEYLDSKIDDGTDQHTYKLINASKTEEYILYTLDIILNFSKTNIDSDLLDIFNEIVELYCVVANDEESTREIILRILKEIDFYDLDSDVYLYSRIKSYYKKIISNQNIEQVYKDRFGAFYKVIKEKLNETNISSSDYSEDSLTQEMKRLTLTPATKDQKSESQSDEERKDKKRLSITHLQRQSFFGKSSGKPTSDKSISKDPDKNDSIDQQSARLMPTRGPK